MRAHRLARHHLDRRLDDPVRAVQDVLGLQAQVQSYGELSLWTRAEGVTPAWVRRGLMESRSLVKCWAMRGTLHLVTAEDFRLFGAALEGRREATWQAWLRAAGLPLDYRERLEEKLRRVLASGEALTRKQLAAATGEEALLGSWGSLLKPPMERGVICFGPQRGPETTFVDASRWLGAQPALDPLEARKELLRRYLRAYGPASPAAFARWAGGSPAWAAPAWRSLAPELAEVRVEGLKRWLLAEDVASLERAEPSRRLRLLAGFDVYVIGHFEKGVIYRPENAARVSRKSGWISPVVVVGGRVAGVWFHELKARRVVVSVELFERLDRAARRELEAEVAALEGFFGVPCGIIEAP